MTSESDQNQNRETVIEELTAYLDGELDQESIEQVERRLGEDEGYLAEMQALQMTWDLLDTLPEPQPNASFTQTTMEMVASELVQNNKKSGFSWNWLLRIAVLLAIPALVFAMTSGMIRSWQTQSDRELIDNLSVISHHELYRLAKCDPKFVKGLMNEFTSSYVDLEDYESAKADEFPILLRVGKSRVNAVKDGLESRTQFIGQLSVEEKKHLQKQFDVYQKLPAKVRNQVEQFDRDLGARADSAKRLVAMRDFYEWMQQTEMEKRNAIRDSSAQETLDWIIREKVKGPAFDNMPSGDIDIVVNWYEATCRKSETEIRERFVAAETDYAKKIAEEVPRGLRRVSRKADIPRLVNRLFGLDRSFVEEIFLDEEPEFVKISLEALSDETQIKLRPLPPSQIRELLMSWAKSVTQSKCIISRRELSRFRETLGEAELLSLRDLPDNEYRSELEKLYRKKLLPEVLNPEDYQRQIEQLLDSGQ